MMKANSNEEVESPTEDRTNKPNSDNEARSVYCTPKIIGGAIATIVVIVVIVLSVYFTTRPETVPVIETMAEETLPSLIKVAPIGTGAILIEYTELLDDNSTVFYYLSTQDLNSTVLETATEPNDVALYLTRSLNPTIEDVSTNFEARNLRKRALSTEETSLRIGFFNNMTFPFRLPDSFLPGDYNGAILVEESAEETSVSIAEVAVASFSVIVDSENNIGSVSASASTTAAPSKNPTLSPTLQATKSPTTSPTTASPSMEPTITTSSPTATPTSRPTAFPTTKPSPEPSPKPTSQPTISHQPSMRGATPSPTVSPTIAPTEIPTKIPTKAPTAIPSSLPTNRPTVVVSPTDVPTNRPSARPTGAPSRSPTKLLTVSPTSAPVAASVVLPPILTAELSGSYNIGGTITVDYVQAFENGQVINRPRLRFDVPNLADAPGPYLYLSKRPYSETRRGDLEEEDIFIPIDSGTDGQFNVNGRFDQFLDEIQNAQDLEDYTNGSWIVWCRPFGVWIGGGEISVA